MPIINQVVKGSGGSAPAHYIEKSVDANGKLVNGSTIINLTGVTDVGEGALKYAYANNTDISGAVDLSSLTTISGSNAFNSAFQYCTNITSVDLSSLISITGGSYACRFMFQGCTKLVSVDMSSFENASGNNCCADMFNGCTKLENVYLGSLTTVSGGYAFATAFVNTKLANIDLSSLTTVSGDYAFNQTFQNCSLITSVSFDSLTSLTGTYAFNSMFQSCSGLTNISFYALTPSSFGSHTNQFYRMLYWVTGCTVHFPMAIQSTIGSWTDITNGFGGTNTTVLFDIVTSLTGADSNTYTRKQKESTSTATAWTYNDTLYYTSGTTEPSVGDTIYSDSACTTAVTTISAIA